MKHQAIVELWDDGTYSIYVPDMKKHSLNAQGSTVEEAKNNLLVAVEDYVDMYKDMGKAIPKEINNPTFEYKYDIASFFDYFDWINVSRLAEKAGINASLLRQYKKRITFASEKQNVKIQNTVHRLAEELLAVRL
ncbi:type II toxin-antitoxin system HicB family antitoxin [Massilibacteroides sp.]|uniref:type II toxin-antitoxin system HicB family antitoxin n=1 Tax=Massilibacteroides sp. TaxID=2034766 RepID=UPI0026167337|nr:type II toxin-antitoxin system HicB family antitoxin [Massilibacteroides sp.]MDD4516387.1 type II toxin-antitoxin system HicB family antitoxin [Massilibacteroides sp.]